MDLSQNVTKLKNDSWTRSGKGIAACFSGAVFFVVLGLWIQFATRSSPPQPQLSLSSQAVHEEESEREHLAEERQHRLNAIKAKIAHMMGNTHEEMLNTVRSHRDEADKIFSVYVARDPGLIAQVDNKLQGYPNALGLARRMAKDKVFKTQETQTYLRDALQPITASQIALGLELKRVHDDCTDTLTAEAALLHAGLIEVTNGTDFKATDLQLDENVGRLLGGATEQTFKASLGAVNASIQVAVETFFIATTYKLVSKLLFDAVGEEAVSLSVGAGGAAIPFVDIATTIIAVGGTAWTAHDVYKAVGEMRKVDPVLQQSMIESTAQLKASSDQTFAEDERKIATLFK